MADKRKGLVRQFSLQNEATNNNNNNNSGRFLKKQSSTEQLIDSNVQDKNGHRMIKIAWTDGNNKIPQEIANQLRKKIQDPVEVKKCLEHRRPATAKLRTQKSIDRDSILYSRQEMTERLKKAWIDREENKQNINIFLNPNRQMEEEDIENKDTNEIHEDSNKIVFDNLKIIDDSIINKSILSNDKSNLLDSDSYIPSNTSTKVRDGSVNISVTIPDFRKNTQSFEEDSKPQEDASKIPPKLLKQSSLSVENENNENIEKSKSSSAASRREMFQKRSNTVFNGSFSTPKSKPSLQRQMSVPTKQEPIKHLVKRRIKSHRKKEKVLDLSDDELPDGSDKPKKKERCKSAPGGEIVTMVSLVSPAGSDLEDNVTNNEKKSPEKVEKQPEKPILQVQEGKPEGKTLSLKKTAKQVSFQQSTIHAIRSFSASFPSRRNAMAAIVKNQMNIDREKRAPIEPIPSVESRVAKRRHITNDNKDEDGQKSFEENEQELQITENVPNVVIENKIINKVDDKPNITQNTITEEPKIANTRPAVEESEEIDPDMPKFDTPKEKECWVMYKKMVDKGLPVTYDTLLRGLLTPSEYRMTRKEVPQPPTP